jgi:hypothetical protein
VFAGLFSVNWSEHSALSLSIEKAEARVGRPLSPMSVAGVARRQNRRAVMGTAAAVGATAYYTGSGYQSEAPYRYGTVRGARAASYNSFASTESIPAGGLPHYAVRAYHADGPWYGYNGWDDYAARNSIKCTPGTLIKLDDAQMHTCQ